MRFLAKLVCPTQTRDRAAISGLPLKTWTRLSILLVAFPAAAHANDWSAVSGLLQERCIACHSGEDAPLGLHLDSYAGIMAGSENGAVVIPGWVEASPLFHRLTGQAEPRMPLDGPPFLDAAEIELVVEWIAAGANGPSEEEPEAATSRHDPREDGRITYNEVSQIFGRACIKCHSDNSSLDAPPEGLRLNSYEAILAGGDRIVVLPGNAQASEIVRRIKGLASPRMPFDGPPWLNDDDISLISDWIDGGALFDDGTAAPIPTGGSVRLRGIMTGPTEIDGAAFNVTGETRIDDQLSTGQSAEVRAKIAPDGSLIAERIRER
jgi:mono/diheme cytochrome c family protein